MTALIGGSVLLIIVASVSLVMGWAGTNEPLIYTSITSSVASFVCLALAYYRSKAEARKIVAAADVIEGVESAAAIDEEPSDDALVDTTSEDAVPQDEAPASTAADVEESDESAEDLVLAGTQEFAAVTDDEPPRDEGSTGPDEPRSDEVVAIAQRRKYHRPECRYAEAAGGERVSKEVAVARGYDACRVCKP
jgi:hypothetical protein